MESQPPNLKDCLPPIEYGYREEWTAFAARHAESTRRFANIEKSLHVAFQRIPPTTQLGSGLYIFSDDLPWKISWKFFCSVRTVMVSERRSLFGECMNGLSRPDICTSTRMRLTIF